MTRLPLLTLILLGVVALSVSMLIGRIPWVVYNASDSAPRGWYHVRHPAYLRVGDYVIAQLPQQVAELAAQRGYLPRTVPVLKRIAAVAGQRVRERSGEVEIDGVPLARTRDADSRGRPLLPWRHCRVLLHDELFLLNTASPDSFDSRYFGPLDVSYVRGEAVPLRHERSMDHDAPAT